MLPEDIKKRLEKINRGDLKSFPQKKDLNYFKKKIKKNLDDEKAKVEIENISNSSIIEFEDLELMVIHNVIENLYMPEIPQNVIESELLPPKLIDLISLAVEKWVFLDLETCGLYNSPIFLIGLMVSKGDNYEVIQFFARDYTEEVAILKYLEDFLKKYEILITFNGKRFDYPLLIKRGKLNDISFDPEIPHLDLYLEAQKIWMGDFTNLKLQTLEKEVLNKYRIDDLSGNKIPAAYDRFVTSRDVREIEKIIEHNINDLVSLGELLIKIIEAYSNGL